MKTSKFWFFFLLVFIFSIGTSKALQIKNIYLGEAPGDRWIEVYNDREDIIDFTTTSYRIMDNSSDSKREIKDMVGEKGFPSGATIFIYKSLSPASTISESLPETANLVFRSNYSLAKEGAYIQITDNKSVPNVYTCASYGNVFCPDGGDILEPIIGESKSKTTTEDNKDSSNNKEKDPKTDNEEEVLENNLEKYGDIQVLLPKQKTATALAVNEFIVSAIDSKKQLINSLDFNISFGDGGEIIGKQEVSHIYTYPGDYILIAEAKGFTSGAKAIMNIKVIEPDIKIEKVGEIEEENYIELKNNTNYDLYLSGFLIKVNDREYVLPKNLMLGKNRATKISGDILGFKMPSENVSLLYPNRKVLTKFEKEATSTLEVVEILLEENTLSREIFLIDTTNIESLADLPQISSNNLLVNVKEENTSNIKLENTNTKVSNFNIVQKESQTVLKRLVLEEGKTSQKIVKSGENKTKEQNNSVDIKLITWLKNLVY